MKITKDMLGLYKSPHDPKDIIIESFLVPVSLPESIDRTTEMSPVRLQSNEGSCVGFATSVGVKEWQEMRDYGKFISLSPRFVYEHAKKISGHTEGTTLAAAMKVIHSFGVCEEKYWPYIPKQPGEPEKGANVNAAKHRVKTYARIRNLDSLKAAIADDNIGVVLIGVLVYKGMMSDSCRRTGVVPDPTCWEKGRYLGGHALCAVGYEDSSPFFKNDGHIKVKNSWGKDFGDKGYLYLSYKNIKANMMDAMTSIDVEGSENMLIRRIEGGADWIR